MLRRSSRGYPNQSKPSLHLQTGQIFAVVRAFLSIGSSLFAFISAPPTFNFPLMNNCCGCALPATIF